MSDKEFEECEQAERQKHDDKVRELEALKQEAEKCSFRYTLDKPWACEVERKQIMAHFEKGYLASAESREKQLEEKAKRIAELEARIEQLQKINNEQKETLKKVRIALIQERTANIMNYGKGGVEMFDSMFEILKGVSN
jgi:hypothetical protein